MLPLQPSSANTEEPRTRLGVCVEGLLCSRCPPHSPKLSRDLHAVSQWMFSGSSCTLYPGLQGPRLFPSTKKLCSETQGSMTSTQAGLEPDAGCGKFRRRGHADNMIPVVGFHSNHANLADLGDSETRTTSLRHGVGITSKGFSKHPRTLLFPTRGHNFFKMNKKAEETPDSRSRE